MRKLVYLPIFLSLLLVSCSDRSSNNRTYILTTGTTGGTYYPVGVAIATIAKSRADIDFSMSAISSAGSMENIKLLRDNQAQFALILGAFAAWAWEGEGPIRNPQRYLRSVGAMWPSVEHFVLLTRLVKDGTLMDLNSLDGERYVIGMRNSGAEHSGKYILNSLGIDYESKFDLAFMGYSAAASAMQDGNIVGMNLPAGAPVTAITQVYAQLREKVTVLNFSERELELINEKYPLWDWYEIPAGTYPYQDKAIRTTYHPNILVVREDVPEEAVYQLTRLIWENLPTLQEIHSATKEMSLDIALEGIAVPLHPGALRYYREKNLVIPEHLLE